MNDESVDFDELREVARGSLAATASLLHHGWEPSWHHRVIARSLENMVTTPGWDKLVMSLPPRHGKTALASHLFPPWYLATHPHETVIIATYGGEYADDIGRKAREYASSEAFESLFGVHVSKETNAITRWELSNHSTFYATSIGATITGRGANCLLVDDFVKNREEAESQSTRDKTWDWFNSTAFTRLEKNGRVACIGTRWHPDDLIGRLIGSSKGWRSIVFPAIAEEDEVYRKKGEPLWQGKYDLPRLESIRDQIGRYDWSALYQQHPTPLDGSIFRESYLKYYTDEQLAKTNFIGIFQAWDTGVSGKHTSARSACTTWGIRLAPSGREYWLLDVFAKPLSFPDLRVAALSLIRRFEPDVVFIEEQQTGRPLIDELTHITGGRLKGVRPKGTKETRAALVSSLFETGRVWLPQSAPWLRAYVAELLAFPNATFLDQVDSTTLALAQMRKEERRRSDSRFGVSDEPGRIITSIYGR